MGVPFGGSTIVQFYGSTMLIDYHSLGKLDGTKYDHGDMEAIIPAKSTKWGMDEQIYQQVANRMLEAAEAKGFPYEVHTLEDLAFYYFGEADTGRLPWKYQKEKVFFFSMFKIFMNTMMRLKDYRGIRIIPAVRHISNGTHWFLEWKRTIGASLRRQTSLKAG